MDQPTDVRGEPGRAVAFCSRGCQLFLLDLTGRRDQKMDPAGRLNPNRRGGPGPAPAPASSPTQPPFDLELLRKASATLTPQAFLSLLETDVYPQLAALHKSISSGLAAKFEEAIKLQEGRDVYLKNVNYVGHKASLDDQVEELVVAVRRNWKEGWEHHVSPSRLE